jgi:CheY-like chemotaxis protein
MANNTKRVLVVEDDDAAWTVIAMCLEREPYQVEREKDGAKALELIQKGGFDAVLLDLMLPGIGGQEILKVLDQDPRFRGFPILINSSIGEMGWTRDQLKSCENLRIEFTSRPFDPLDLVEAIRKVLGLSTDPQEIMKQQAATPTPPRAAKPANRKKVLIVDDDSAVRGMYVPYFSEKGYDALAASNGKEALDVLKKEKVALIILDLNMPQMSGEEVLAVVADHPAWKGIPIIIDTAVDPASGRMEKIRSAFEGKLSFEFFQRPTSLPELNDAINRILIP